MREDFAIHNEEVGRVWNAYRAGRPIRVPMFFGTQVRYTMHPDRQTTTPMSWQEYWSSPENMLRRQLEHQEWCAFHLWQDAAMGLPEHWTVWVDFQNVYEAAALGCPIQYCGGQTPDTLPLPLEESGRALIERGPPDPFESPFWARVWEFHAALEKIAASGYEYRGRPIRVGGPSGMGTDGPLTGACNVRGAMQFCVDLLEDPPFADDFLAFLVETTIRRIRAFRERMGQPVVENGFGFADDSLALLSTEMARERLVPHYRRLIDAFAREGPNSIHLCGDATRHFRMLRDELNIRSFDTGFPVDFGGLREELGENVEIVGGPSIPFLTSATPAQVREETRRILESGVMHGGRFILREGNNLAPEVSDANCRAMYDAVREFGRYPDAEQTTMKEPKNP